MPSDDGEGARPLTAGEIEAIRARGVWDAGLGYWQTVDRLLATLDAWRPVLEAVATAMYADADGYGCIFPACDARGAFSTDVYHAPDCPVTVARRLLGQEA